jgi:hypothetical protein
MIINGIRVLRAWACYHVVLAWPTWLCVNPLCRATWSQRLSWRIHEVILPYAGDWAFRHEVANG